MANKFLSYVKNKREQTREKGFALIWYIIVIPLFLALAGLGIETAILTSLKTSLQSAADSATQGTVSQSYPQGLQYPALDYDESYDLFIEVYDANRSGMYSGSTTQEIPFLDCVSPNIIANTQGRIITGPRSGCSFVLYSFEYDPDGGIGTEHQGFIRTIVGETAHTVFLHWIGIPTVDFRIVSEARLGWSYD